MVIVKVRMIAICFMPIYFHLWVLIPLFSIVGISTFLFAVQFRGSFIVYLLTTVRMCDDALNEKRANVMCKRLA